MSSIRVLKRVLHQKPWPGRGGVSMKRTVGNNTGIYGRQYGSRPNNAVKSRGRR